MLENTPQLQKQNLFIYAMKLGMFSATHESVAVPVGRVSKLWTTLRANQIVGFLTEPSEKKINIDLITHLLFQLQVFQYKVIKNSLN